MSENLDFRGVPTIPYLIKVALCAHTAYINNVVCAVPCFLSGNLEFGYVSSRRCLRDQPTVKTLRAESLTSVPGWQHFTYVVAIGYWENEACPL